MYRAILVIFQGYLFTVTRRSWVQSLNFPPFFEQFVKFKKSFFDIFLVSQVQINTEMQKSSKHFYRYNNNSAMSKLMVASNSQGRQICKRIVSFYVPVKPWPQQSHQQRVYQSLLHYVLCLPFCAEVFIKCEVTDARYIKTDHMSKNVPLLAIRGYHQF